MLKFDATQPSDVEHHICHSYREGEWIVHQCQQCDYELRDNWHSGEMQVRNSKVGINHSGFYFPEEYQQFYESRN